MTALDAFAEGAGTDTGHDHTAPVDWRHGPALPAARATSVPALVGECLRRFPDSPVVRDGERTATWRDLEGWSGRLASLWARHLPYGGRCAILLPNGLSHLVAELACWRLGALAAPLFTGFGAPRLAELLNHLDADIAVVDDEAIARLLPPSTRRLTSTELWSAVNKAQGPGEDRAVQASDPCLIQFTSGSTGLPRGVVLTHDNLASQQAAFALHWPEIGPGDRLAAYLPWHHSFGGLAERLWSLCRGAELTVIPAGGRNRQQLIDTVRAVAPTVFFSVPKIHAVMAEENLFAHEKVRWVFTAGAPMPCTVRQWYDDHEIPVCEGWGLTETSPSCTLTRPGSGRDGVVGWPIAGVDVGVRPHDGRILVRGPNVMAGYFRRPSPTLSDDGVLDTGDVGAWNEDGLWLRGRADHQLKLGNGEKVCAASLESTLMAHPAIHHAVVLAEPELVAIVEVDVARNFAEARDAVTAINASQPVPYKRIQGVFAITGRMTIANGQLTASHKISRGQVQETFRRWLSDGGDDFVRL